MFETISKKDIISVNKQFDTGIVINASSIDYALNQANQTKSWLRACALLVRAVLLDHVFEEGNKRTAAALISGFFEEHELTYDPEKIARAIVMIPMKNTTSITQIEKVILNAIIR